MIKKRKLYTTATILAGVFSIIGSASNPTQPGSNRQAATSKSTPNPQKTWAIGEGPLLKDLVLLPAVDIKAAIQTSGNQAAPEKGKFESQEEYLKRLEILKTPKSLFLTREIKTGDKEGCPISYAADKQVYSIKNCRSFSANRSLFSEATQGKPIILSNAYDRREIRVEQLKEYFVDADHIWSADYPLSKEAAMQLDNDLMVGVVVEPRGVSSFCSLCKSRESQDASASLTDTLNSLQSLKRRPSYTAPAKTWKDDAFRSGSILEDWSYRLQVEKTKELVIYRKSDQRVLLHQTYSEKTMP